MKKTLTLLVGAVLMAAMVFVGCKKPTEDVNKTISGSDKDKKVDWTNDKDSVYRAYVGTKFKHMGGKFTIRMKKDSRGVMGIIFDYIEDEDDKSKSFFIVGIANEPDDSTKMLRPYFSHYTDVTDIQAENFGTKLKDKPAVETEFLKLGDYKPKPADFLDTETGEYVFCIDIYPVDKNGKKLYTRANSNDLYTDAEKNKKYEDKVGYGVSIYPKSFDVSPDKEVTTNKIVPDGIYDNSNDDDKITQQPLAYYINVYAKGSLTGTWKADELYAAAEVEE